MKLSKEVAKFMNNAELKSEIDIEQNKPTTTGDSNKPKKVFTVAIIGCGARGDVTYGRLMLAHGGFRIVSLCDEDRERLIRVSEVYGVGEEELFTDEKTFFEKKRADALIIATQDRDHVRMCVKALQLGYDVLLEKPVSPFESELEELLAAHKQYGGKVVVCHVLRYAPVFLKAKKLIESGAIGRLIRIDAIERVGYWHQAHSFVRGNWRNDKTTSPMIMQKCCHDFDLLQWYAASKCETVWSTGELTYFRPENKPEGASDRCENCIKSSECPYSVENVYIGRWKKLGERTIWPFNVVDSTDPITEESLRNACNSGPYGRCVFACDNNVVDHQATEMVFANGVRATLVMTAFTADAGRAMCFHGTEGEITFDELSGIFTYAPFGKGVERMTIGEIIEQDAEDGGYGHGGGDGGLVSAFYHTLEGSFSAGTELEKSVESHLIALAAEKSRIMGETVQVHNKKEKQ